MKLLAAVLIVLASVLLDLTFVLQLILAVFQLLAYKLDFNRKCSFSGS